MRKIMFLDDIRTDDYLGMVDWHNSPKNMTREEFVEIILGDEVIITVRSNKEARAYVMEHGVPDVIFFDHDLGYNFATGFTEDSVEFVNWLIRRDYTENWIPENFKYFVHSANPVGAANIASKIDGYLKFRRENDGQ